MAYIPIHLGWNTEDGIIQNHRYKLQQQLPADNSENLPQLLPALSSSSSSASSQSKCEFENTSVWYVMFVAIGTYFCPLVVLCTVYIRVFAIARRQIASIRTQTSVASTPSHAVKTPGNHHQQARKSEVRSLVVNEASGSSAMATSPVTPASSTKSMVSETKATVTLGSVVLAFAVCWVPYFVLFAAKPFVVGGIDPTLDLFVLWLGYANSMLNPFLYAFYGSEFRHGFHLVLCRWRRRSGSGGGLRGFRDQSNEIYYL